MSVKIIQTGNEIVFKEKPSLNKNSDGVVVRISSEAHATLQLWSARTGLSITKLASEFVLFASEHSRLECSDE